MQLSFPSLSSDVPPVPGAGANVPADGTVADVTTAPASSPVGFAQLLATIVPTGSAAIPGAAIAGDLTPVITDAAPEPSTSDPRTCGNLAVTTWTPLQAALQNDGDVT